MHARAAERREEGPFYGQRLSPDEQRALALAAQLDGVDGEIAVLRILIRRVLTLGDLDRARKGIDTLVRTLKARHALEDHSADRLASSLERVLDTLGEDIGTSL